MVVAVVLTLEAIVAAILERWYLAPIAIVLATAAIWGRHRVRAAADQARAVRLANLRWAVAELDTMTPTEFELAVRDLMIRDGITARHVGQRGDQAADVLGRDPETGCVWVAQCKHTTTGAKVGVRVICEVNGTAGPAHGADLAIVVTNGSFTRDARKQAGAFGIHLIDRDRLDRWASEGAALHQLLKVPSRSKPQRLRNAAS